MVVASPIPSDRNDVLERVRAMIPALKERAERTEELRHLHPDTVAELKANGLMRVLQPARWGGGELDYAAAIEMLVELARGCASTAWCAFNYASHNWMLGMFAPEAQEAVWGEDPARFLSASLVFPAGRAQRVPGGYTVSGRWPFTSGVDWADFVYLGATVAGDGDTPELRILLAPRSAVSLVDTWHVAGLAGTGSKHMTTEGLFVAEHMSLDVRHLVGGPTPGSQVNPSPLYRLSVMGLFPHLVTAVILGNAIEATNEFVDGLAARATTYSKANPASFVTLQLHVAEARALCDAGRVLLLDNCHEGTRVAERGVAPTVEQIVRWRRDGAWIAQAAKRATDLVHNAGGGGSNYLANPMQRRFRDCHAGVVHIQTSWDANAVDYGRVALGLPSTNPTLARL